VTSDFAEIHDELRSVARDLLVKDADWRQVVDAGWVSLEVPEALGGAGASFVETAILLEEMGRAAAANRFLGTTLAVGALTALAPNNSRDELLEAVGTGTSAAFATGFSVSDGTISGRAEFVPDAAGADTVLLLADDRGTPVVVTSSGLTVTPQLVLDATRALAVVTAERSVGIARPGRGGGRLRQPRGRGGNAHRDRRIREGAASVRQTDRLVPGGEARVRRHAGPNIGGSTTG
jgi:hypothetical protein